MKCRLSVTVIFLAIFSSLLFASPSNDLESNFKSPPDSAKPHTWWHWMNGNVSSEGITADLEAMAEVGIGGAQIFNVSEWIPDGPAPFMSPQWLDLVKHAATEADRLGIELCLHNCAGWSSSGGPWITPEYSMQVIVYTDIEATGPAQFNQVLPQPKANMDFYRDIAIIAFPTPANDKFRIDNFRIKSGRDNTYGVNPNLAEDPVDAAIATDSIIDLTSKTDSKGLLQWQVPQGNWTILRLGHTTTGKTNHPAPAAGCGLECDKLSRQAMDLHWNKGIQPILDKLGPLAGKSLNNVLIDSYEVGPNNWTPKMREEFKKRTGYDLLSYLPAFSGRVVENAQMTERFFWDYRRIVADLFAENYYGYFADKCRKRGLLTSVEPYDGPFECLQVGAKADIIMGEYWVGGDDVSDNGSVKTASSTAHTHGQNIIGAESFTADPSKGRWQNYPGSLKLIGDSAWCSGINRFIFHRYAHQPWMNLLPGMTMGQWGTHFDRTNTWWSLSKPWITYLTRSQYMLQQGHFVADVLISQGETAPNGSAIDRPLRNAGYNYDDAGTDTIENLYVKNGLLTLPSGMQYKLLVLQDVNFMTEKMAKKIEKLVKSGAVILGNKPMHSPSLIGYPKTESKMLEIVDKIWGKDSDGKPIDRSYGKGRVLSGINTPDAMKKLNITPDFKDISNDPKTTFIHRKTKDANIYFVASKNRNQNTASCAFRVTGKKPQLWNSITGTIQDAPMWQVKDDTTIVTIPFEPSGSVFVVFDQPLDNSEDQYVAMESKPQAKPVEPSTDKLEILKAQYGVFGCDRPGLVDVTDTLINHLQNNKLEIIASNSLAGDPIPGKVKALYVKYTYGDQTYSAKAKENEVLYLPTKEVPVAADKKLQILVAGYGTLPSDDQLQLVVPESIDIAEKLAAKVKNGRLQIRIDNDLADTDPAPNVYKMLKVTYSLNGDVDNIAIEEHKVLNLPIESFEPVPFIASLSVTPEKTTLAVPENGQYTLTKNSGKKTTLEVSDMPDPIEIKGDWKLKFTPGWNAPEEITIPQLSSWTTSDNNDIRYYSGTAKYYKQFDMPHDFRSNADKVILDLGQVLYFAKVKLNDQDLGILWKYPFRLDITDALKTGSNDLEIAVTNLWVNRLIGDEQYPDDCQWDGPKLARWPDWFVKNQPRPVKERLTFTTWKHWRKNDRPLPSGLLGPVKINAVRILPVTD